MPMLDFLEYVASNLDPAAAAEFGEIERKMLEMSMNKCGMHVYPALSGSAEGKRCSGDMICEICAQEYYAHPMDWRVIGYGNVPFLNVLCNGERVKL